MALHTLRRRPFEDSLKMASLTLHLRVTAGKGEARSAVIDFYVGADAALYGRSLWTK